MHNNKIHILLTVLGYDTKVMKTLKRDDYDCIWVMDDWSFGDYYIMCDCTRTNPVYETDDGFLVSKRDWFIHNNYLYVNGSEPECHEPFPSEEVLELFRHRMIGGKLK